MIYTVIGATMNESKPIKALALFLKWNVLHHGERRTSMGFSVFQADVGRLCIGISPATGTCWMMGFGEIKSPVSISQRLVKGFEVKRLLIDFTDALMPWLQKALTLANSNRVGFASPSTVHQKA